MFGHSTNLYIYGNMQIFTYVEHTFFQILAILATQEAFCLPSVIYQTEQLCGCDKIPPPPPSLHFIVAHQGVWVPITCTPVCILNQDPSSFSCTKYTFYGNIQAPGLTPSHGINKYHLLHEHLHTHIFMLNFIYRSR